MTTISVRQASHEDIPWLTEQLRGLASAYGTRRSLFCEDAEYVRGTLENFIAGGAFFVAERSDGERLGFVAGMLLPHPLNPAVKTLQEVFWWVRPDVRGGRAAALLLDRFTKFGAAHADITCFGAIAGGPTPTRVHARSFARRGYHLHELSYIRESGASE
jgi:hypothetical protein